MSVKDYPILAKNVYGSLCIYGTVEKAMFAFEELMEALGVIDGEYECEMFYPKGEQYELMLTCDSAARMCMACNNEQLLTIFSDLDLNSDVYETSHCLSIKNGNISYSGNVGKIVLDDMEINEDDAPKMMDDLMDEIKQLTDEINQLTTKVN